MDVEILSRIQFAFTVAFHYIYPPLSIGLGLLIVLAEAAWLRTDSVEWRNLTRFLIRLFALTFGLGVATGIVMEFEFGTNWAVYSRYVGDVFGSALAAEGIFAFALESGFLGVLLFGWGRVKPRWHFVSALGVWLGSMFSAVWIVVANSWQQTPAGYHVVGEGMNARAEIVDFWAMVFNPSSVERLMHVWLGSFLAGAFLALSIAAWYLLRRQHVPVAKKLIKVALPVAFLASWAQLFSGHVAAEVVAEHQPAKLAALEGHYEADGPADMYLLGWVDQQSQEVHGLGIPGGLSILLHQDPEAPVTGLNAFKPEDRPGQVNAVFQFYHLMVALGMMLIALSTWAAWSWWRGTIWDATLLLKLLVPSVLLPQIANQAGWFAAEMGRQPWVVYNLLRTSDALSESVRAEQVLFSLVLFTLIYVVLLALFLYLMRKKILHGPEELGHPELNASNRQSAWS